VIIARGDEILRYAQDDRASEALDDSVGGDDRASR
jgi:hypothetical protein